jgi:L-serine deaminase
VWILKKGFEERYSTIRKYSKKVFSKIKAQPEDKSEENKKVSKEVMKVTEETARMRDNQ